MKRIVTFVLAALLLVSLLGGCVRTEEDYKAAIYRHVTQKHHGRNAELSQIGTGKYVQIEPDGSAQATVRFDVQNAIGMTLHMSSVVRLNRDLEVTSCDFCDTFGIASSTGPGWSMGSGASEETEPETEAETEPKPPATEPEESSQTFTVNQELLEVSGMTYGELRARYGEPQIQDQTAQEEDTGIWVGYTVVFPDGPGLGFEFDQMTLACSIPLEDGSVSKGIFAPIGEVFLNYGDGRTIEELRELLPSARMTISPPAGGGCDFRYSSGKLLSIYDDSQEGYIVTIALGANESEEAIQQIDDSYYLDSQTPVELVNTGRWA